LLLCLLPHSASAQVSVEVSGGYSLARDPRDDVTLPAGWMAGAAVGRPHSLSAVADVSGQYKTIALLGSDAQLSVHTVMGGVRASARIGPLTEFAQMLAGIVRVSGSAFGSTETHSSLGVQPGAGVDYRLSRSFAARAELDVRLIRSQPETDNSSYQVRFVAGLVCRVMPR
jgi:hypothetical protein